MAQMQLAGNVGRRHDDAVRILGGVDSRSEVALFQPTLVDWLLYIGGIIGPGNLGGPPLWRGQWL